MEFDALIEARRSIRAYQAPLPTTEQISAMIEAAIQAPSWKNSQTARYYAVLSTDARAAFLRDCLPEGNAKKAENAALVVSTFVMNRAGFDREGHPDNECGNGWGFYDCGLHNMLFTLKAKELGFDTLIMGLRDGDAIRRALDIPETEQVAAVIAVGTAAQEAVKPKRKTPADILKVY